MKVKEAYPDTKEALSDQEKTSAQKKIKYISTLPSPLGQPLKRQPADTSLRCHELSGEYPPRTKVKGPESNKTSPLRRDRIWNHDQCHSSYNTDDDIWATCKETNKVIVPGDMGSEEKEKVFETCRH